MKHNHILPLLLAACFLLSSCTRVVASSSESVPPPQSSIFSEEALEEDLTEEVKAAMLGAYASSYVAEHDNVALEEEQETLGIEHVESFYRSYLGNMPAQIYIGRYNGPEIVVYHLNFTGGDSYTLTLSAEERITEHTLNEINRTENEYIFSTDTTEFGQAAEVGRNGSKGLTINNLCTHTWQHDFPDELVQLVGTAEFNTWKEQNQSRSRCNINLFEFLRHFKISYRDFIAAYGEPEDAARLNEIVREVYPERMKQPKTPEPSASAEEVPEVSGENFLTDVERGIIGEINAEREALGLKALQYDNSLRAAARIRSRELCESGVWAHTRPNGDPWQTVLSEDVPVKYVAAGENLANLEYNDPRVSFHTDAHWWFEEWKNSEGHYENMIREEFTHVGAGLYYVVDENGMITAYATTIFASYQ